MSGSFPEGWAEKYAPKYIPDDVRKPYWYVSTYKKPYVKEYAYPVLLTDYELHQHQNAMSGGAVDLLTQEEIDSSG